MALTVHFPTDDHPAVEFSPQAWADMHYITEKVNDEVATFGIVTRLGEYRFLVEKIYLPAQEVNGGTTEVQPEHFGAFAEWLLSQPNGEDEYLRLRMWHHSHVNMAVGASGQDEKTLQMLTRETGEAFVAVRTNKRGEVTADIRYPNGLQLNGVACRQAGPAVDKARWDELIKNNVTKLTYKGKAVGKSTGTLVYSDYYQSKDKGKPTGQHESQAQRLKNEMLDAEADADLDAAITQWTTGAQETYSDWLDLYGFLTPTEARQAGVDPATWAQAEARMLSVWNDSVEHGASVEEPRLILAVMEMHSECFAEDGIHLAAHEVSELEEAEALEALEEAEALEAAAKKPAGKEKVKA